MIITEIKFCCEESVTRGKELNNKKGIFTWLYAYDTFNRIVHVQ